MKARIIRIQSLLFFLILCAISCTEKEELVIENTVPVFGRVEAVMDGYKFAFSATISIDNPSNPYYVYGFEVSSSSDMADATVVAGKGLGKDGAFTGLYDLVDWKGGDIVYYRAFISRREGEEPLYSETFKVDVPKREYDSLKFTSAGKSTIKLENEGGNKPQLYYSYDEFKWTQWDYSELEFTKDKPIYINGDNPKGFSKSSSQYSNFSLSGSPVGCSGSVMTLIDRKNSVDKIPSDYCFKSLFEGCEILESAPLLPATTLTDCCYIWMFTGCFNLKIAPDLPAKMLSEGCYVRMFSECTSLQTAPELPVTTLAEYCYCYMFSGCINLQSAPKLPATILAGDCYRAMFRDCTSLKTAPKLPATYLADRCYFEMFAGCTSLQSAPVLPATDLAFECYAYMFLSCTSLNNVTCLATDISANGCTDGWLSGVSSTGTFVKAPGMNGWTRGASGIPEGWNVENSDGSEVVVVNKYLTFTSEGTTTISLENKNDNDPKLYYSYDKTTWKEWDYSSLEFTSGKPLYLCGDNHTFGINTISYSGAYNRFIASGSDFSCQGDIMSLIDSKEDVLVIPNSYSFCQLFFNCANLRSAPMLPATTLKTGCYDGMFYGCTSLQTAPALPATTLANYCYDGMFYGCTNLQIAPELPATTLAYECYYVMFMGCSSLQSTPELPATTLAEKCYAAMFSGCSSLKTTSALPATTLARTCYGEMFYGCTSLQSAPELPATTLESSCYLGMFYGCTSLQSVTCLATDISAEDCTKEWLFGVASTGTFVKAKGMNDWTRGDSGIPEGWNVENSDGSEVVVVNKYLTFTSEGTTTISLKNSGGNAPKLYYSYDKTNWTAWDYSSLEFTSTKPLYLCGDNPEGFSHSYEAYSRFIASGSSFSCEGDIMSLLDSTKDILIIPSSDCYYKLFRNCSNLTIGPDLPATTLARACYYEMFYGCSSLLTAPELPATTLAEFCYCYMFEGCTSLQSAPKLPATILASYCYSRMFWGCTSLRSAPNLPATTLADGCYYCMFSECTSLTTAPDLPATALVNYCYHSMFEGCTSLQIAPDLPATTLAERCYYDLFRGCRSLNSVNCFATDISAEDCTKEWLSGVSSTGTFVKAPGMNDWTRGVSGIPEGWNVENSDGSEVVVVNKYLTFTSEGTTTISLKNSGGNAPKLYYSYDKTNWTAWDYSSLEFTSTKPLYLCGDNPDGFSHSGYYDGGAYSRFIASGSSFSCEGDIMSLLDSTKDILIIPSSDCYYKLFYNCSNLTIGPDLPATTLADECYYEMFCGCTSLQIAPKLPATVLAERCYGSMFFDCISLQIAPELPATTLADECYFKMFSLCTKLKKVTCLATDISAKDCTTKWLFGVPSTGTFVKAKGMNDWTRGDSGIPEGWTVSEK